MEYAQRQLRISNAANLLFMDIRASELVRGINPYMANPAYAFMPLNKAYNLNSLINQGVCVLEDPNKIGCPLPRVSRAFSDVSLRHATAVHDDEAQMLLSEATLLSEILHEKAQTSKKWGLIQTPSSRYYAKISAGLLIAVDDVLTITAQSKKRFNKPLSLH